MLQPNDFYQLLEEFYASKKRIEPVFRLGTVDLAYTSGLPKVKLDGDDDVTVKQYSHIRMYSPTAGDRVMLALVGNTYIILGRLRNDPLQAPDTGGSGGGSVSVTWSDVTGKPTTFTPSAHTHAMSDITGLTTALSGKSDTTHTHAWGDITGKPTTFTPSAHTHLWADITDKPTTFAPSTHTHLIANITDFPSQTGQSGKFLTTNGTALSWATSTSYTHPTGDGNLHVPATGTTNNLKVLKAGSTAGSIAWGNVAWSEVTSKPWTESGSDITQTAGNYIMGGGTGSIYAYAIRPKVDTDNMLIRSNSEVRAYQATTTNYVPVRASSFPTGSSYKYKQNIVPLSDRFDALQLLNGMKPMHYHLKGNLDNLIFDKPKVGFISEW